MNDELATILITFGAGTFIVHGLYGVITAWQRERTLRAALKEGGGAVPALLDRPDLPSGARLMLSGALLTALAAAFAGARAWNGQTYDEAAPLLLFALLPGLVYLGAGWWAVRRKAKLARQRDEGTAAAK
ncbi:MULTISPECIES: hypothetical protein [Pacificimonas]|uniref:Uncharacterized protein n=1 Tax=Pacificimonas aurantium TaxID=1250540 RepID=A0ABS7WMX4_9SPHN|nr:MULTISPECIES: hypothetical protein [Pacificimonas]MBZ6379756.1 hypothetical protein [Pacificimonas aurantium]